MRLRSPAGDEGTVAVLVAIFSLVMFGFAALVVDLGDARALSARARSAVDAATLAGATAVGEGGSLAQAVTAIKTSANRNARTAFDWSGCSVTPPTGWARRGVSDSDCILFYPASGPAERVQVVLPAQRSVGAFGSVFGYTGIDVSASAQAQIRDDPVPGCGLCLLGDLDTRGPVTVTGGDSFAAGTGRVRSGGSVTVGAPGVITFASRPNPATGPYLPDPRIGAPADPFLGSAMPSFPATTAPTDSIVCGPTGVSTLPSAVYRNIDVRGACTMTGVVAIAGNGRLRVRSGGSLTSADATVYLTCGSRTALAVCPTPRNGGELRVDSGGSLSITGSFTSPFSVVADPNNRRRLDLRGSVSLGQPVYARQAVLDVRSTATLGVSGRLVALDLDVARGAPVDVDSASGSLVLGPVDVRLAKVAVPSSP